MILAVFPFLESIGVAELFTSAAVEFTGSEVVGAFVGNAVTGTIAGEIAAPIDRTIDNIATNTGLKDKIGNYFDTYKAISGDKAALNRLTQQRIRERQVRNYYNSIATPKPIDWNPVYVPDRNVVTTGVGQGIVQYNVSQPSGPEVASSPDQKQMLSMGSSNDPFDLYENNPRDIARLIINVSKKIAGHKTPRQALLEQLELEPEALQLAQKLSQFASSKLDRTVGNAVPKTEEYMRVSKVYNGKNITAASFKKYRNSQGRIVITGIDELGTEYRLEETRGLVLPSYPGSTFIGPNSRNNDLPNPEMPVDFFAFFHDYSYSLAMPNKRGDLQFISRISQNMDRIRPEDRDFAKATIIYFANISLNLSLLVDQPPGEDIFSTVGGVDPMDPDYQVLRSAFYQSMESELVSYSKTDSFFSDQAAKKVADSIENLSIQLS